MKEENSSGGTGNFDILGFIELVKERPPIYQLKNPEHHNRYVIDSLWTEIAEQTHKTVTECKTKWHQLRNNYARELRFERANKHTNWHLKTPLEFLRSEISTTRGKLGSKGGKRTSKASSTIITEVKHETEHHRNHQNEDNNNTDVKPKYLLAESIIYEDFQDYQEDNSQEVEVISETPDGLITQQRTEVPQSHHHNQQNHPHDPLEDSSSQTIQVTSNSGATIIPEQQVDGKRHELHQQHHHPHTTHTTTTDHILFATRACDETNKDFIFFESIFPDVQKLSARRKRKFKEAILVTLNRFLDEDEEDPIAVNQSSYASVASKES